jgi:hypothetical protein
LQLWDRSPVSTFGDGVPLERAESVQVAGEVKTQNEARACHDRFAHSVIVPIVVNSLAPGARRLPRVFELVILVSLLDAL